MRVCIYYIYIAPKQLINVPSTKSALLIVCLPALGLLLATIPNFELERVCSLLLFDC